MKGSEAETAPPPEINKLFAEVGLLLLLLLLFHPAGRRSPAVGRPRRRTYDGTSGLSNRAVTVYTVYIRTCVTQHPLPYLRTVSLSRSPRFPAPPDRPSRSLARPPSLSFTRSLSFSLSLSRSLFSGSHFVSSLVLSPSPLSLLYFSLSLLSHALFRSDRRSDRAPSRRRVGPQSLPLPSPHHMSRSQSG